MSCGEGQEFNYRMGKEMGLDGSQKGLEQIPSVTLLKRSSTGRSGWLIA
jgi:hypothetical protein